MATQLRTVIVYGGSGQLGSHCVAHFKSKGYRVCSIGHTANDGADVNVLVPKEAGSLTEQAAEVTRKADEAFGDVRSVDGIFCVAGGWAGGNASSKDFIQNCDLVLRQSVWSSVIAARIAAKHLKPEGLLVLTGAEAAQSGTPGMIGYGMSKAAVHQLVQSLAADKSGLAANCCTVGFLPNTLDTAMNRKWMGEDKLSSWTPLGFVAELFEDWLGKRPISGRLYAVRTKDSKSSVQVL